MLMTNRDIGYENSQVLIEESEEWPLKYLP